MIVTPLTGRFGAEVTGIDVSGTLHPEDLIAIENAFAEHSVLCFRDQELTIEEFEAFARQLGDFGDTPFITPMDDHPAVLRLLREADEQGPLFGSGWHSDWSFQDQPPSATLLYGVDIPPAGGDTAFVSQALAYETLSPVMRGIVDGLNGIHSARRSYGPQGTFGRHDPTRSMEIHGDESALRTVCHPMVRTHPISGRRSLFVNEVYTIGIEGMSDNESRALLDMLFTHSRRIDLSCRIRWQRGTLTMWDNRMTQHYAIDDYAGHRREMWRITLAGERPQ
jgi:taurine dioxygenase